ncbi:hypothetical protein KIW84_054666 [Lathyrus oleraceus]|uniref:25S rRNA (uridine-N(3))-methyltransferase BMT5-like domain-containing protein n=1 Tax=Pisum sativum TaxID=3888 RepID=A0A9D5AKD4_PEA|nr:hypothetical protein KIW84_054666 [Pisum sativum]
MLCQLVSIKFYPTFHCKIEMLWPWLCHQCSSVCVAEVTKKYKNAKSNLEELQKLGAYLLHGVDATKMKHHPDLKIRRFDRIIFNFPHAGFHRKEDNLMMIK